MLISKNKLYAVNALTNDTHLDQSSTNLYPWLIIFCCALFIFYKFILQISPGIMTSELMQAFHINAVGLGNLAATYFYAYLAAQCFVGPLLDRYSPRYLTAGAIALGAIGTLGFATAPSLMLASMSRALIGIGMAFATVNYMKMSAVWFGPNKAAFIDGLLATAAMLGALCGQIPLLLLVSQVGWKRGLVDCGLGGIVLAIVYVLLIRDKKDSRRNVKILAQPKLNTFVELLRRKENWLLFAYAGLAFTPLAVLGGLWGNPFYITIYHLSPTQAASLSSLVFLGLGLGAPLWGVLADRYLSRINTMFIGTSLALLTLICIIYVPLSVSVLSVLLFMFGSGTGAFMACYALGKELNQVSVAATIISLINSGDALLSSITEPFIGKLLDYYWQGEMVTGIHIFPPQAFHWAFSLLPIYLLSALICLLFLNKFTTR